MIVAHILQSNIYSGAENVVCQIIELFSEKTNIEMIYVSPSGPIDEILRKKNIKHYILDCFSIRKIKKAIKCINPDIVHAHDFNASVRSALACKKVPIISHLHNNPLWGKSLNIKTLSYMLCSYRFKYIIGVSNAIKDEFYFANFIKNKFCLIQNVVDSKKVIELGNAEKTPNTDLIFVGRLSEPKNPIGFLKIVNDLVNKYDNRIIADVIGSGELENECKRYIEEHDLGRNVNILGFKNNPYTYMKNSKMLVMTSMFEGFGLVAVEAMILGVPVATLKVGGLVDIVDNKCGIICESIESLTYKISVLIKDEYKLKEKGILSKNKVRKYTNMREYQKKIMKIYDKVYSFGKGEN